MGYTMTPGLTTEQAITYAIRGCPLIAKSGKWRLVENTSGQVILIYFVTEGRYPEVAVKPVSADMGPFAVAPKGIFNKYVELVPEPLNDHDAQWRERCREAHAKNTTLAIGDEFIVKAPDGYEPKWSDGVPTAGTYIYLGKFRAKRSDGVTVRLPKQWRRWYDWEPTGKTEPVPPPPQPNVTWWPFS